MAQQSTVYQFNSIANITQAEQILSDFRELLVLGQSVELDASQIERIDTSVMQLIVSLKKSLTEKQLALSCTKASSAFQVALSTMGLDQYLEFNLT